MLNMPPAGAALSIIEFNLSVLFCSALFFFVCIIQCCLRKPIFCIPGAYVDPCACPLGPSPI